MGGRGGEGGEGGGGGGNGRGVHAGIGVGFAVGVGCGCCFVRRGLKLKGLACHWLVGRPDPSSFGSGILLILTSSDCGLSEYTSNL